MISILRVIVVLILSYTSCKAQVSTFNGIISSSNLYKSDNLQGYWTIGELIIEPISGSQTALVSGLAEANSVFIITGDISETEKTEIQIYPVPFQSNFFIEAETKNLKDHVFALTDEAGKMVNFQINFISDHKAQVEVADVSTGLYLLTIRSNTSTKVFKLIKE
jgi:hypothetical protein